MDDNLVTRSCNFSRNRTAPHRYKVIDNNTIGRVKNWPTYSITKLKHLLLLKYTVNVCRRRRCRSAEVEWTFQKWHDEEVNGCVNENENWGVLQLLIDVFFFCFQRGFIISNKFTVQLVIRRRQRHRRRRRRRRMRRLLMTVTVPWPLIDWT